MLPCQGRGRGFESRLPLQWICCCGGVAKRLRQGSAKPPYGGSNPPAALSNYQCSSRGGGMVDAADLKSASRKGVWVRVPPSAVGSPAGTQKSKFSTFGFCFSERISLDQSHLPCHCQERDCSLSPGTGAAIPGLNRRQFRIAELKSQTRKTLN
jgi:hypothetical protein